MIVQLMSTILSKTLIDIHAPLWRHKTNTAFQLDNLLSVLSPADAEAAGLSLVSGVRILDHSSALFGRTKFTVSVMVLFLGFTMRGSLASIPILIEVLALGQLFIKPNHLH